MKFAEVAERGREILGRIIRAIVEMVRRLVDAIRHVRTGGASTRARAYRRSSAPARRCSACHQPLAHSDDWRDHLNEQHPEWT